VRRKVGDRALPVKSAEGAVTVRLRTGTLVAVGRRRWQAPRSYLLFIR